MAGSPKTVLVAGTSVLRDATLRNWLLDAGYGVIEATDARRALSLALVSESRPEVVVTEMGLSATNGFELCRSIRKEESLGDTAIVVVVDPSKPQDAARALEAGADAVVSHGRRFVDLLCSMCENAVASQLEQRVLEKTARIRKRVRELKLLQSASRLLSEHSFDRPTLEQLVKLIPAAWEHPGHCKARITFRDLTVATPGWQPTRWRQSVSFTTSGGVGSIEVGYVGGPTIGDASPFLPDEAAVLDSLAEMLVTYAERDLAEERRKSLENQLRHSQKMEALGTLAGGVAHDFNNLLTAIGGNAELALSDEPAGEVRQSLEEINRAVARARDLVGRILVFSRQQETDRKPVAIPRIIEEALTLVRSTIPRNVDVRVRYAGGLPPILADASQLHQVMMNLATNAVHAMQNGGGVLTIEVDLVRVGAANPPTPELMPGKYVRVTVADTGTGISPEIVDRIFDPFFTTKGHAGTGLGLAVVDGIIRDHQGIITVRSQVGQGTTFTLHLPVIGAVEGDTPATIQVPARGSGQHILYVDDDEAIVLVMTRVLESLGYRATAFTDPHAALQAFRTSPREFDAVISDVNMKGMSGPELARAIIGLRADIPVAVISGHASDLEMAAAPGVRARIHKPTTIWELSMAVKDLLR